MATLKIRNETNDGWYEFGHQGPQGNQGFQGHQGPVGAQGTQGPQGNQGTQGATGTQGQEGAQGERGYQGYQGPQGNQGAQGATGPQGLQGAQGERGYQGYQGPQGNQGAQGTMGMTGITWRGDWLTDTYYNPNDAVHYGGNSYICIIAHTSSTPPPNTNWALLSQEGAIGPQGPQGLAGAQGPTGPQGFQGAQGSQGVRGYQGSQGPIGVQGPTGPQGYQGLTGSQGSTGPQGNQGLSGPQGSMGYQGPTGAQGPTGPQGSQGPQGAQGLLGDVLAHSVIINSTGYLQAGTSYPYIRMDYQKIIGMLSANNPWFLLGNLVNYYGVGTNTFGLGLGNYSAGQYLLYLNNILKIYGEVHATSGELGDLAVTGDLTVNPGSIIAGGGKVTLSNSGIKIDNSGGTALIGSPDPRAFIYEANSVINGGIWSDPESIQLVSSGTGARNAMLRAYNPTSGVNATVQALISSDSKTRVDITAGKTNISGGLTVNGALDDGDGVAYLKANGKAADSDKLDGKDSTEFLLATGTAANSTKLANKTPTTAGLDLLEASNVAAQRTLLRINYVRMAAINDNAATSFTPPNAQGFILWRKLAGSDGGALVAYDAISPTAYIVLIAGTPLMQVRTGALTGTTGTDGKITISAHTDGKIYIENRSGGTIYSAYVCL